MLNASLGPLFAAESCGNCPLAEIVVLTAEKIARRSPKPGVESVERVVNLPPHDQVRTHSGACAELLRFAVMQQRERRGHLAEMPVFVDYEPAGHWPFPTWVHPTAHQVQGQF